MTYKATLKRQQGSGSDYAIIMVGPSVREAIEDYFERKEDVGTIHSITHPWSSSEYHVEHSGRDISLWQNGGAQTITTYADDVSDIILIAEVA